jgi:hypothetical protein
MCDSYLTLKEEVNEAIDVFVNADEVFTAFDVTKTLRKVVKGGIRHNEVKNIVFQEWKDTFCDTYERTLTELEIDGKRVSAYVYHPETVSAKTHPFAVQDEEETKEDDNFVDVNIAYTTRELSNSEKRLSIPKEMLINCNMKAGDVVYVDTSNSQKITISKDNNSNMSIYSINADGRLRFSKVILDKVFNKESDKYNIYATFKKNIIEIMPFA